MAARPARGSGPKPPPDPLTLVRQTAGRHATGDGRFVVEQASGGWMLTDAARTNELGLPLVRGPFPTLGAARAAVEAARVGPGPISNLAERIAAIPRAAPGSTPRGTGQRPEAPAAVVAPPVIVREFRSRDGEALRVLWAAVGFGSVGDDDMRLRRFAQRNPGLFLVASQGLNVIGSAMGGWDGRRGWIYHVAVAETHRRAGIGTRLVRQVEDGLKSLGCPKVNVIVLDGNGQADALWRALGYQVHDAHQFGRVLPDSEAEPEP